MGSAMRSEATAAAEFSGKVIMHDPFAMRPFFGYNFGHYLQHWLSMEKRANAKLPRIFHVNWFRKDAKGKFLWPGFGENCRVLEWIAKRVAGLDCAVESPIGECAQPCLIVPSSVFWDSILLGSAMCLFLPLLANTLK